MLSLSVNAQVPKEKVKELIKVMQADTMIGKVMDQMIPVMQQQLKATLKTDEQKQKLNEINTILIEEVKIFTTKMINGPMVTIYAKHFNEKDIQQLIRFYKSKTGKKMVALTPTITAELMQTMAQKEIPAFQQRVKERIQMLKNK